MLPPPRYSGLREALAEVANDDDSDAGAVGELGRRDEGMADALVAVRVDLGSKIGDERVDDEQAGLDALDDLVEVPGKRGRTGSPPPTE